MNRIRSIKIKDIVKELFKKYEIHHLSLRIKRSNLKISSLATDFIIRGRKEYVMKEFELL